VNDRPLKNLAHSVHQRLLNRARESTRTFNELLQYYAMERFLYRLCQSPHGSNFILKGALTLAVWEAPVTRPTRDIDLLAYMNNDLDSVRRVFREVCREDVEPDGLCFDPETVEAERITEHADYSGVRVAFRGYLGDAEIPMQVDIGFGDKVVGPQETAEYPTLLDMPEPRLRVYSRESTIAEKLEAMVKLGEINSRMRDFYDIWLLSRQFAFEGSTLTDAVRQTFRTRGTTLPEKPLALRDAFAARNDKQKQWRAFLRKSAIEDAPDEFSDVIVRLREFLGPVVEAVSSGADSSRRWHPSGGWQETGGPAP
jgi:predicted nucleotidyltransferase component of viral defense system